MITTREMLRQVDDLPEHEVVRLLMAATGLPRADVILGHDLTHEQDDEAQRLLDARRSGQPLQYLEGSIPFGPADLDVDPRALIPRPETEYLVELAAGAVRVPHVIVDLGTGSGCLAVALKLLFPAARVVATDISPMALSLAHENAQRNDVDIEFHVGSLYEALPREMAGAVDLLVSNPPYVTTDEMAKLPAEVIDWEPRMALDGGDDGLRVIRPIVEGLATWLAPAGVAMLEVGENIATEAASLAIPVFEKTEILADLTGRDRFVKISFDSRRFEVAK